MSANLVAFGAFCFYANPRGEFRFFYIFKELQILLFVYMCTLRSGP